MPRPNMEVERRKALIGAAADMIGERGSLDVAVKDIAKRAGMSSGLAFHYFGDKDEIISETMRHLLRELRHELVSQLEPATTPAERLDAMIRTNFAANQFDKKTIAAWLVFYIKAFSAEKPARLLSVYFNRTRSNILHELKQLMDEKRAGQVADGLVAMIDGIYIRQGLRRDGASADAAITLCRNYIDAQLSYQPAQK